MKKNVMRVWEFFHSTISNWVHITKISRTFYLKQIFLEKRLTKKLRKKCVYYKDAPVD